jgi:hypothetical protein
LLAAQDVAAAAKGAETKIDSEYGSYTKTVGKLLNEAKKLFPETADFKKFLGRVVDLKKSRAYELMAIADGRTTEEKNKEKSRDRQRKSRAQRKLNKPAWSNSSRALPPPSPAAPSTDDSVTEPRVTESPEISIEQRRRDNASLGMTAAERSKENLEWVAVACREYLPSITVEAHRQEARNLVATLTCAKCSEAA